jgi:hypothetical protein
MTKFVHNSRVYASKVLVVVLCLICVLVSPKTFGTELKAATARAFQQYVDLTEARIRGEVTGSNGFLQIDSLPEDQKEAARSRLLKGEIFIQFMANKEDGAPIQIPGGLVHHWLALAFIPAATAEQVLQLAQNYSRYAELYKPDIQNAEILTREGEHFRVYYRLYRHAVVTVVYNAEFDVDYFTPDSSRNYGLARSVRIAEVEHLGEPDEREYPVGRDHGYLWRMNLYTRCVERDGGVYVQVEFLALSRTIPAFFALLVNRYVHSVPREYLKGYLETTRKALSSTESRVSFVEKPRGHGDHRCLCPLTQRPLSAGLMGVGGLLPMQEAGPAFPLGVTP